MYLFASVVSGRIEKAILVHDPVGLGAFGCFSHVENQSLLYANLPAFGADHFVGSSCFPVP